MAWPNSGFFRPVHAALRPPGPQASSQPAGCQSTRCCLPPGLKATQHAAGCCRPSISADRDPTAGCAPHGIKTPAGRPPQNPSPPCFLLPWLLPAGVGTQWRPGPPPLSCCFPLLFLSRDATLSGGGVRQQRQPLATVRGKTSPALGRSRLPSLFSSPFPSPLAS